MQFSIIAISFLASFAMAGPAKRGGGGGDSGSGSGSGSGGSGSTTAYDPCTSLLDSQPLCCATDVLGLVSLDCAVVSETPTSADDFVDICSEDGQQAQCCTLSLAGQALLCADPVGA